MTALLRGRPAHAPGATFLKYTPNGRKLITVGLNGALRIFQHGSDSEPAIIDVVTDSHTAVAATDDFFIVGAEDGSVTQYSLSTNTMQDILIRCSLPVRDISISPDGQWAAVASDELEVKIVNIRDMNKVIYLREQTRPVKAVSFDGSGSTIAVSCTDGIIYMYSLSSEQPQLIKRIDGLIKSAESESETSVRVAWHPDGRAFAAATATKDIQVMSRNDWARQKTFLGGHRSEISAIAWSPNGALLVSADASQGLMLWDAKTLSVIKTFDDVRHTIVEFDWHPTDNVLSYTNNNGELFIREDFIPASHAGLRKLGIQPAPMNAAPLTEVSGNARKPAVNGHKAGAPNEDDYLDHLLEPDGMSEDGLDFIEDDDGAGYAEQRNTNGKRSADGLELRPAKRTNSHRASTWQPELHAPLQSGSTPWKGNRRYLCLNLIGFVWTVDQDTHHTVTVEFYDRQEHRDFHFTDPYLYDKACLNDKGSLFSCPKSSQHPAMLHYRPHETWTTRSEWRTSLPLGEEVTSMSLSETCIVATTTKGYVRVYSLFGVPLRVYRQKSTPAVTCASWRDYVMTVGNGPCAADGSARLLYTIENVKRDEILQSEDVLPLQEDAQLTGIFFSDQGDPCIYDSDGVLLVLLHWRTPGQAKWVPLLDTKTLDRLAGGKKNETYWPVAVADNRFHCIILKGGEQYPYFPRPLLSDFDFRIPIADPISSSGDDNDEDDENRALNGQRNLEELYVRNSIQHALAQDLVEGTNASSHQRAQVPVLEREVDKVLLQMLANECREGEERGMKALEIATLMRDRTGKMLEAAIKVAARFQRDVLGEKITQLAERRLVGLVDDNDD